MLRFERVRDGFYREPTSGLELHRGIDDSDGYERIEWQIWTVDMARIVATHDSLNAAKRHVRTIA
jgi:hypothetical protein